MPYAMNDIRTVEAGSLMLNSKLLLALLAVAIVTIAILIFFCLRYRRLYYDKLSGLVRYISISLAMKPYVPMHKRPIINNLSDEVTPKEFIQILRIMLKKMTLISLLVLSTLPITAQDTQRMEKNEMYEFHFVPQKDMFYVPWNGNGTEPTRLLKCIEENRTAITEGRMYLLVTSYGVAENTGQTAKEMARIRRNRVKSELILRAGIKEENFVTDRMYTEPYRKGNKSVWNVVVVMVPASVIKVAEIAGEEAAAKVDNKATGGASEYECPATEEKTKARCLAAERKEKEVIAAKQADREHRAVEQAETERPEAEEISGRMEKNVCTETSYTLALRVNLLRWATLTPDLGLEWRINSSWGILVNGTWTSWSWNDKNRRYALWEVSPEVRHYIGEEKRGYIGAMYQAGQFNYKLSGTGRQGDLMGGGLTGGYRLELSRLLALDFSLGIGCTHADYDSYTVIDGVRVRQGESSKNYWGVNHVGITLVWKLIK